MSGKASAWAALATGFFILSLVPSSALMMALWGVALGASPVVIGLLVGIRSLLPIFLSIHGGALVDRLGVGHRLRRQRRPVGHHGRRLPGPPRRGGGQRLPHGRRPQGCV